MQKEFVQRVGYPYESHFVTTSDDYILNLHRIPYGKTGEKKNKVVYLEHGINLASTAFVLADPQEGLGEQKFHYLNLYLFCVIFVKLFVAAFLLADLGYDVWMGNARGNIYSRNHTTLDPDSDKQFWNFTWHEIGVYDLPTSISYVLEKTNSNYLYYGGHSQGTTAMYVLLTMKPEYNDKIKAFFSLAPIAFMNHLKSPLFRLLAPFEPIGQVSSDEV